MDSFGDDLTELILSYLTLGDKVRLECVSKQWKRCVFQRQFAIKIDSDCPNDESMKVIAEDNKDSNQGLISLNNK